MLGWISDHMSIICPITKLTGVGRLACLAALCLTAACSSGGERRDPELQHLFIDTVCGFALIEAGYDGMELPDQKFCSCLAVREELPSYDDILKIALVEQSGRAVGELTPVQVRASIACGDVMEW